jgi:protein CpxP
MKLIKGGKFGAVPLLLLFLLLLVLTPERASAQEEAGGPPPAQGQADARPTGPVGDLIRQLNLTPDQIEKIKSIRERNREARRLIGVRIRAARVALDRAIYVENADETVVEQRARELAEAQSAQVRLQAMTELGVRRILTPEQLETFRALRLQAETDRRNRRLQGDGNSLRDRRRLQNGPGQPDGGQRPGNRRPRP